GASAWNWITRRLQNPAFQAPDLLISDVEMPQMDGFHLTKRFKEHPQLHAVPVLLYSSILTPDNIKKGKSVRADAQITKPELHRVVEMADRLIEETQLAAAPDSARPSPAPRQTAEAPAQRVAG